MLKVVSDEPDYSSIASELHPKTADEVKKGKNEVLVHVRMSYLTVPNCYSADSLTLLRSLAKQSDDIKKSNFVGVILYYRWEKFAYRFFLARFVAFVVLLLSLTT